MLCPRHGYVEIGEVVVQLLEPSETCSNRVKTIILYWRRETLFQLWISTHWSVPRRYSSTCTPQGVGYGGLRTKHDLSAQNVVAVRSHILKRVSRYVICDLLSCVSNATCSSVYLFCYFRSVLVIVLLPKAILM